jgi:hypothetical protein
MYGLEGQQIQGPRHAIRVAGGFVGADLAGVFGSPRVSSMYANMSTSPEGVD